MQAPDSKNIYHVDGAEAAIANGLRSEPGTGDN
jgi:hypothetical protein